MGATPSRARRSEPSPDFKGIKTGILTPLRTAQGSEPSPDFKGIKTMTVCCLL
ncbi:hypothetical protein [Tepidimonas sp.]|uniref:hypothetical protein n=1 Tax=Tepidimonas sp. TaxID=2002775 RepID=UPI00391AD7FF